MDRADTYVLLLSYISMHVGAQNRHGQFSFLPGSGPQKQTRPKAEVELRSEQVSSPFPCRNVSLVRQEGLAASLRDFGLALDDGAHLASFLEGGHIFLREQPDSMVSLSEVADQF